MTLLDAVPEVHRWADEAHAERVFRVKPSFIQRGMGKKWDHDG
jgi:hypothetical protein